jgi:hypothetical protein
MDAEQISETTVLRGWRGLPRLSACLACLLLPTAAAAQIPADKYLKYVPLGYPSMVRQTAASERFTLFGDRHDAAYRDELPKDGIDDRRAAWLQQLAVRFAPLMVRNTPLYPVDFRTFYSRPDFAIHVDTWDIARSRQSLLDQTVIPLGDLAADPCVEGRSATKADCRLLELIKTYGPERRPVEPEAKGGAEQMRHTVMYFDFPGFDAKTWQAEYWPATGPRTRSASLAGSERAFVHPFVAEAPNAEGGAAFELVLQYWFFYPENDGPNNHEGDWEHINVIVSPRSRVAQPLDADAMTALVGGGQPADGQDPLVIRRIEYYLHHYVFPMDFSSPNAYAPREAWEREVLAAMKATGASRWIWDRIRERAWQDDAETRVNTHPVVWIGGDALGIQNVLDKPGLRDRDGHASYPFQGYYKQIGPGVGERVIRAFDLRAYLANPATRPEYVENYADTGRIVLMPDWERVHDLALTDPNVRREWGWMVLPLRFGFPASPSPAAGTVAHADMGNVSVVGPAFNGGWNRVGDSSGYDLYEAVKLGWATPMSLQDSFFPRLGWLNAPILYFMFKPPLDLAWRTVALPARAVLGSRLPTFVRASAPPRRTVSLEVGAMITPVTEDFSALFVNRDQLPELGLRLAIALPPGTDPSTLTQTNVFPTIAAPVYSLVFHISPRFSTENSLASYKATVGFDIDAPDLARPIQIRGTLDQFDYHGNTRFNLTTGRFQPYLKFGTGFTSYGLKGVSVDGQRMVTADSPRFRPRGGWRVLFFNETILGGGLDIGSVKLWKAKFGGKASYTAIHHDLGFERDADVEDSPVLAKQLAGTVQSTWRHELRLFGSFSF